MKKILFALSVFSLLSCDTSSLESIKQSNQNENSQSQSSDYVFAFENQEIDINKTSSTITPTSIEEAVDKVYNSVVVINAYYSNGYGSGSGVIFSESEDYSYVITCHHVIEDASSIEVTFYNNETVQATLVGGDPDSDIAVIAVDKVDIDAVSFISDSDTIKLGSTAIAIGNPLGILSNTVTTGVVSSLKRDIEMEDGNIHSLLQTDAAINSGNSGGGLFNTAGELIGIVSAKYSATGVEGLGFAVPANIASYVAENLCELGYVPGRYNLGFTIEDGRVYVNESTTFRGTKYKSYDVAYIYSVEENSSSYGYLQAKDIITGLSIDYLDESKSDLTYDGEYTASALNEYIKSADLAIGDKLNFKVKANGDYTAIEEDITVEIKQYIYR